MDNDSPVIDVEIYVLLMQGVRRNDHKIVRLQLMMFSIQKKAGFSFKEQVNLIVSEMKMRISAIEIPAYGMVDGIEKIRRLLDNRRRFPPWSSWSDTEKRYGTR